MQACEPWLLARAEQLLRLTSNREAVTGLGIATRDSRVRTFAPQHPGGDRLAVRENIVASEDGVAGAYKLGGGTGGDVDPAPVIELAVRRPCRWRPIVVDDVAAGP